MTPAAVAGPVRSRRGRVGTAVAALGLLLTAGCQASPSQPSPPTSAGSAGPAGSEASSVGATATATATASTDPGPPANERFTLDTSGRLSVRGRGQWVDTSVRAAYPIGSLDRVPREMLAACGWDGPDVLHGSAWFPLVVTVTNDLTRPTPVRLGRPGVPLVVRAGGANGPGSPRPLEVAVRSATGSTWQGCSGGRPWTATLAGQQSLSRDAWVRFPGTTARTASADDLVTLLWTATAADPGRRRTDPSLSAAGDQALRCLGDRSPLPFRVALGLFRIGPFDVTAVGADREPVTGVCRQAAPLSY